jgi:hypothetical protein
MSDEGCEICGKPIACYVCDACPEHCRTRDPECIRITIASPPDRDHQVAEIFLGDEQLAELHEEGAELTVEIHPRRSGQPWALHVDALVGAIERARQRLRDR